MHQIMDIGEIIDKEGSAGHEGQGGGNKETLWYGGF